MPSMKKFTRRYYFDLIISAIFILSLGVTSISNNTYLNLILKLVSVIFFSVMTVLRLKFIYEIKVKNVMQIFVRELANPFFKKFIVVFGTLITFSTLTLSYSHNVDYGVWKLSNLVLVILPFIVLILININHNPTKLNEVFVKVTEIFLVTVSLLIFLIKPFDYLGIEYGISLERWSHVVFGRVSGFLFLFYLLHLLFQKEKVSFYNLIVIALGGYSIYLTGLRAAIAGFIIIIPMVFVVSFLFKRDMRKLAKIASILVVVVVLGLLFNNTNESYERLGKISSVITTGQVDDGAVNARLDGWIVGWEMITDSPILGRGIGGYNSDFRDYEIQKLIEYPHNLFIELVVELGVVGWIFSIMIILFVVYFAKKILLSEGCGEWEDGRRGEWEKRRMGEEEIRLHRKTVSPRQVRLHRKTVSPRQVRLHRKAVSPRQAGRGSGTVDWKLLTVYFLLMFSLWLAMFSKDVSSQSLLWVSISVLSWQFSVGRQKE